MKFKIMISLMILIVALVGCSKDKEVHKNENVHDLQISENTVSENIVDSIETRDNLCADILNSIWGAYDGEKFSVGGGDGEVQAYECAGNISTDNKELLLNYCVNDKVLEYIDNIGNMQHMLNANVFTAIIVETSNKDNVALEMETNIKNNHWMCGSPNVYSIMDLNNGHVLIMYGEVNIVNTFGETAIELYDAVVLRNGTV